jgi:predicted phosphodiesterase
VTMIRRAGIIGDVHGEASALKAILTFLQQDSSLDALLCTGDLPAKKGEGDTDACCQLLTDANALTIHGNHDRWALENARGQKVWFGTGDEELRDTAMITFLKSLPPIRALDTVRGPLLLCHGLYRDDMAGIYPGGNDSPIVRELESYGIAGEYCYLVAGHTHYRMIRPLTEANLTILNPGTLRYDETPGFLIADFEAGKAQWYDIAPFTYEITEADTASLVTE